MILRDGDGEGELEIAVHKVQPPTSMRPGDFRATVRVSTLGFGGTNEHVWIAADDFQRFIEAVRVLDNEVTDTNASGSGPALSLALQGIRNGRVERNTLRNTKLGDSIGLFVSDSSGTSVTGNTLEALAFGVVFTGASTGTCSGNGISGVATPTMGVSCLP